MWLPTRPSASRPASEAALGSPGVFLLASVIATGLLYVVPLGHLVAYPLVLLSTIVHELGHGVTGVLVGGHFDSFRMEWDASGVARVSGYDGRIARALVSAGGLVGPACAAALGFAFARRPGTARGFLFALGVCLLVASLWVVRGLVGAIVVPLFGVAFLVLGRKASPPVAQLALAFVSVQLALSVFSRGDYLFTPNAGPHPSDVANIATALFLPYWFWGLVCGAFSLAVLGSGAWFFLRGARSMLGDAARLREALRSR